ncbi:MAG: ABC transporter ATP-binding protein [Spirochaeta sp.]|jgi:branched-chain amino acid transport system ATP-binding protein|nr:ABC transporter ATP-binding protein [Spirochaeta sp.]
MLSIQNVKSGYGRITVLHDLSLEVDNGVIGLFGPNGAGKTTLINAILGMNRVETGTITFEGREIQNSPTHEIVRGGIALVPQERELFPLMTVMENLVVGAEQIVHAREQIAESLEEVFSHFPILKEREKQLAGTMSGGQQRMLAVGRALMARPRLLILDEPSLGLQPSIVHDLFTVLSEMTEGVTILLTEQNVRESLRIVDRGYVLENGKIVLSGSAEELAHNPEIERSYLGL